VPLLCSAVVRATYRQLLEQVPEFDRRMSRLLPSAAGRIQQLQRKNRDE